MDYLDQMLQRELGRRDLLRYAAVAGGAGVLAACGNKPRTPPAAGPVRPPIGEEVGDLLVFEWAGYELPSLYKSYKKEFPQKPEFAFLTSDDQALGKVRAGFEMDLVHPCIGYINDWIDIGAVQPFDPSLISNMPDLNPAMVKAGQVDGKQYFIPLDWGFSSLLYRSDEVDPVADSWELMYDERYAGKISWWDNSYNLIIDGYIQGVPDPFNMTDDELEVSKQRLIERKPVVRNLWTNVYDMQADFNAGNIWIAYAWPDAWVAAKGGGLDVTYMQPQEGRISWVCGFTLSSETANYHHAHEFVDAWASPESGTWLLNNYAFGHSNTTIDLSQVSPDIVEGFRLDDPSVLEEPTTHIDRYIPRRQVYNQFWEEVKAA